MMMREQQWDRSNCRHFRIDVCLHQRIYMRVFVRNDALKEHFQKLIFQTKSLSCATCPNLLHDLYIENKIKGPSGNLVSGIGYIVAIFKHWSIVQGMLCKQDHDCNKELFEPPHGKTNNLPRRKQRRRSASQ